MQVVLASTPSEQDDTIQPQLFFDHMKDLYYIVASQHHQL